MFPIRYRNTCGSLGELEIAWKQSPCRVVLLSQFLVLPNSHSCCYNCYGNTENVFYFLNVTYIYKCKLNHCRGGGGLKFSAGYCCLFVCFFPAYIACLQLPFSPRVVCYATRGLPGLIPAIRCVR